MNGKVTKSSEALEDLEVAQAPNGKAEMVWVKLSCTYTPEDLPVNSNEVTTIDKIKRWGYLDNIKAEVNVNGNIEITLLIGANCVKALGPRQSIASRSRVRYALRTLLGWCIVGPMYRQNKSEKLSCNWILVKSVVTGFASNHYFTQSDKVRDTSVEGLLMRIYEHNFVESQLQHSAYKISINYDKLSGNDRRFLDLMDKKAVKVDGHEELTLSPKDEDFRLPNNRAAAMKRLESLRRKFEKDDQFFKEYKNFM